MSRLQNSPEYNKPSYAGIYTGDCNYFFTSLPPYDEHSENSGIRTQRQIRLTFYASKKSKYLILKASDGQVCNFLQRRYLNMLYGTHYEVDVGRTWCLNLQHLPPNSRVVIVAKHYTHVKSYNE